MSRSYRDDNTDHSVKAYNAQKNTTRRDKEFITVSDEDGVICSHCKKFCTYIYLARNTQCYSCGNVINIDE